MDYSDFPKSPSGSRTVPHAPLKKVVPPTPAPPLDPLAQVIRNGPQYTVLADTNHKDKALSAFLVSNELLSTLHSAGVKHLFLENASDNNIILNKVSAFIFNRPAVEREGGMPADIEKFYKENPEQVMFMSAAREKGIQVHFPDHPGLIDPEVKIDPVYRCYQNSFFKRLLTPSDIVSMSPARERKAQDPLVAERIMNVSGKEKSVVIWGDGHTGAKGGLDETLGKKTGGAQVVFVLSKATEKTAPQTIRGGLEALGLASAKPDYYYNFETKALSRSHPEFDKMFEETKKFEGKWPGFFCKPPV